MSTIAPPYKQNQTGTMQYVPNQYVVSPVPLVPPYVLRAPYSGDSLWYPDTIQNALKLCGVAPSDFTLTLLPLETVEDWQEALGITNEPTDPELEAIAALTSAPDKGMHFTGSGTAATHDLTEFSRSLLALDDANDWRALLGVGSPSDPELVALASLTSAPNKGMYFTGPGTAATFDLTSFSRGLMANDSLAAWQAALSIGTGSGTIGGSTGGIDNTLLMSDGAGGSTLTPAIGITSPAAGHMVVSGDIGAGVALTVAPTAVLQGASLLDLNLPALSGYAYGFRVQGLATSVAGLFRSTAVNGSAALQVQSGGDAAGLAFIQYMNNSQSVSWITGLDNAAGGAWKLNNDADFATANVITVPHSSGAITFSRNLKVFSSSDALIRTGHSDAFYFDFGREAAGDFIFKVNGATTPHLRLVNGANGPVLLSDHNLGIGTGFTSINWPPNRLSVIGDIASYNFFTSASSYEQLRMYWFSDIAFLAVSSAGTGLPRSLIFGTTGAAPTYIMTNGVSRWQITADGHLVANADNIYDIGANGAFRPRNIWVGNSVLVANAITTGGDITMANGTTLRIATGAAGLLQVGVGMDLGTFGSVANVRSSTVPIVFYTGSTLGDMATSGVERMRIDNSTGNVGIGSTFASVPPNKLSVLGDIASYRVFTSASDYERLQMYWSGTVANVVTEQAGTGTSRALKIGTSGPASMHLRTNDYDRWTVTGGGHFLAETDNTYDIGASGANRPRNIYAADSVNAGNVIIGAGYLHWTNRLWAIAPSDGVLKLSNNANDDFNRLQLGGATSSYPALGRAAGNLAALKADGSAYTGMIASDFYATTKISVGNVGIPNTIGVVGDIASYNFFTSASDYERLRMYWSSNLAFLASEAAGTGTVRQLIFGTTGPAATIIMTNGTSRWLCDPNGHFVANVDNTYDIGYSASNRPRDIHFGRTLKSNQLPGEGIVTTYIETQLNSAWGFRTQQIYDGGNVDYYLLSGSGLSGTRAAPTQSGGGIMPTLGFRFEHTYGVSIVTTNDLVNGTSIDRRLTVSPAGNVGVGLYAGNPTKLAVLGDIASYNFFNSASDYERVRLYWDANFAFLKTESAGTGAPRSLALYTAGNLYFGSNNTNRWYIDSSGNWLSYDDNAYDIGGGTTANRPRNYWGGGTLWNQGDVAFGGTAINPNALLTLGRNITDPTNTTYGLDSVRAVVLSAPNAQVICGGRFLTSLSSAHDLTGAAVGGLFQIINTNTATVSDIVGGDFDINHASAGTITNAIGGRFGLGNNSTGIITNAYGARIVLNWNAGVMVNTYGLYIGSLTGGTGTQTNQPYGIYQADAAARNYFAGKLKAPHQVHANAVAETPSATHTLRLFDAAGTEYKVLCVPA